jgi:hypothetical protein
MAYLFCTGKPAAAMAYFQVPPIAQDIELNWGKILRFEDG